MKADKSAVNRKGMSNDRRKKMKQVKRSKTITYRWWRDGKNEIKPEHIPALEERADEHIAEMMGQGYTSGELNDNIHMTDDDPKDGVEYKGWWEVSTSNEVERTPQQLADDRNELLDACKRLLAHAINRDDDYDATSHAEKIIAKVERKH